MGLVTFIGALDQTACPAIRITYNRAETTPPDPRHRPAHDRRRSQRQSFTIFMGRNSASILKLDLTIADLGTVLPSCANPPHPFERSPVRYHRAETHDAVGDHLHANLLGCVWCK